MTWRCCGALALALVGCGVDSDGDGVRSAADCDDQEATVSPLADEVPYDGLDNDCDPATVDDDLDADGYPAALDCDDAAADVHPRAAERCDGVDQDCDGAADDPSGGAWFVDDDGDGFGGEPATAGCDGTDGLVDRGGDCVDVDAAIHPGVVEVCDGADQNCDGQVDEDAADAQIWYFDDDGDGHGAADEVFRSCDAPEGWVAVGDDCDDRDGDVAPGVAESCDGIDQDCDGAVDEGAADRESLYADEDGDGWGAGAAFWTCDPTAGVTRAGDCDDALPDVFPDALEVCDGVDQDCDGAVDEDVSTAAWWYPDVDNDGHGASTGRVQSCEAPQGYVSAKDDCDDQRSDVAPGKVESCGGGDEDCDGAIDESGAVGEGTWYRDVDGDAQGGTSSVSACARPNGYVALSGDCNDANNQIYSGATEVCGGGDEDCDGTADESGAAGSLTWYRDQDGDAQGGSTSVTSCAKPSGYVSGTGDCDDLDPLAHVGGTEVCGGGDEDCDGTVDEPGGTGTLSWYVDGDGDGQGAGAALASCAVVTGRVTLSGDCDDGNPSIHTGATEVCGGGDEDCDGATDESGASGEVTWYRDADSDGFGASSVTQAACQAPTGYVADATDCQDSAASVAPGQPDDLWNDVDNDCDGLFDEDTTWGLGDDGALTVNGATDLSSSLAPTWTASSMTGASITVDRTVTGLVAGDEVLVVNLHGADTAYASVGVYEFRTVASVSGSTITVLSGFSELFGQTTNSSLTGQTVVVARVPHFTHVTIGSSGALTTAAWNGARGGLLAFRATGTVQIASGGRIHMDARGYGGGATGGAYNIDAYQGDSYAGTSLGGGLAGEGYNLSVGAQGAHYGGGGALICGGGGNYAGGATASASWNGTTSVAAAGATYGQASLAQLLPGSGGGGVWNGSVYSGCSGPGPGGSGGGIVFIAAPTLTASGANGVTASGGAGTACAEGTWRYGAGGGSGGAVWIVSQTLTLPANSVRAGGGAGRTSSVDRAGGNGGSGRIRVDYTTINGAPRSTALATTALQTAAEPDPGYTSSP